MMKKNVGAIDRAFRMIAGPILILVAILVVKSTLWTVILAALGIIWFLTGLMRHCPVYLPFGLSTRKAKEKSA
jgi:uncharacterized membrane protein